MIAIQTTLTERAVELMALPDDGVPKLLLDLGCGSGLSGEALTDLGHTWLGFDISAAMLDVAAEREVEGDLCLGDLGHGLPLRPGVFDGAISISAVQWLCNADRTGHDPRCGSAPAGWGEGGRGRTWGVRVWMGERGVGGQNWRAGGGAAWGDWAGTR